MTALENFASPALTRALGWTLLHSLWQGVLVAAVLAGALLLLRRQRAEVRYVASAGALGVMVALAGITFGLYFRAGVGQAGSGALSPNTVKTLRAAPLKQFEKAAVARAAASPGQAAAAASTAMPATNPGRPSAVGLWDANTHRTAPTWLATGLRYFDTHMPLLVVGWLLGLLAMSLRLLGGLLYVQRLRSHRVRPLSAAWQERMASLAARSGVRRPVALLESALVQVPLVVGHVRPVILLPLGVVAGLSVAHLEAILAHELAHVLRRDYLVNLLQTVAEALFFYHPAVWFVANCVRTERENCCDDAAAALCGGDSLRLARALTALAEWSQSALVPAAPRLALAAINGRGALLNRVRRLVQRRPAAPTLAEGAMAAALVLGGLGLLGGSVAWAGSLSRPLAGVKPAVPAAFDWQAGGRQAAFQPAAADTTKKPAGGTQARPANATAAALVSGAAPAVAAGKARETPAADKASPALQTASGDTIYRRASRTRTLADRSRRVVVDGREMAPPASDGSTVVVTKDKKGRLTDLVVNGQRIETASGWTKTKFTPKGNGKDDSRVEIIEVDPAYAPRAETFVYRGGAGATAYARAFPRVYALPTPALATRIYSEITPSDRTELRRLGLAAPGSFSRVERLNGTYRLQSLGAAIAGPGSDVGDARSALRAAEQALREASTVTNLSAEQR